MKTVETIATVTADGKVTFPAPAGISQGLHRVKVEIDEEPAPVVDEKTTSPKPKRFYKGRPVYDKEDLKHMTCDLPPETDWAREMGIIE